MPSAPFTMVPSMVVEPQSGGAAAAGTAKHGARTAAAISSLVLIVGFLILVTLSRPVSAHPYGQKPVVLIRTNENIVRVTWVVAPDDLEALTAHLKIVSAVASDPSLQAYFAERLTVESESGLCPQTLTSVEVVTSGRAAFLSFSCPVPPEKLRIRLSLLQDLSPDYITLAEATTPAGKVRGVFRTGAEQIEIRLAGRPEVVKPTGARPAPEGRMGRILGALEPGGGALPFAIAIAFGLGALHGLTPGHGKTITAAYIVGGSGTMRQALALGGIVTATHTLSVVVLGILAVTLDAILLPNQWAPWLEIAAGGMIIGMGAVLLRSRQIPRTHTHPHPPHGARIALLGIIGGLIPSPEAVGIALFAFSTDRWVAGLLIVLAFSAGLAAVVLLVALAAVTGSRMLGRFSESRWAGAVPRVAGFVFLGGGVVVLLRGAARLS